MKLIDDLKSNDVKLPAGKSFTTYAVLAILLGGLGFIISGRETKTRQKHS